MTPLGHVGISLLAGAGLTRVFPETSSISILASSAIGGTILDLDLLYRFYQKRSAVFDGTIGQHRFFPTHTPLFSTLISIPVILINLPVGIALFIGLMAHLFVDTLFFPEGINFTYPFNRKMTALLTIKTHKFWAPKPISQVSGWWKNYFRSPLFWVIEVLPTILAIVVSLQLI